MADSSSYIDHKQSTISVLALYNHGCAVYNDYYYTFGGINAAGAAANDYKCSISGTTITSCTAIKSVVKYLQYFVGYII